MKALPINLNDGDVARIMAGRQTQVRVPLARYGNLSAEHTPLAELVHGDLLWVRESLRHAGRVLLADRMPQHLSRLTLEVTGIKIETLFAISKADALCSGIALVEHPDGGPAYAPICLAGETDTVYGSTPQDAYLLHWEATHIGDARERSQKVVAIRFVPHKANIDALFAARARSEDAA
jgi:hypothetical protein